MNSYPSVINININLPTNPQNIDNNSIDNLSNTSTINLNLNTNARELDNTNISNDINGGITSNSTNTSTENQDRNPIRMLYSTISMNSPNQSTPPVNNQTTPSVNNQSTPSVNNQSTPSVNNQSTPSVNNRSFSPIIYSNFTNSDIPTNISSNLGNIVNSLFGDLDISSFENNSDGLANLHVYGTTVTNNFDEPVHVPAPIQDLREKTKTSLFQEDSENINCAICQENIIKNDIIRTINLCNHQFHIECIEKWFEKNTKCPICRNDIRNEDRNNNEN